ncbi:diguanylate cyclase [Paucibacter sp. AS339]|uniref:diguanylate cyclase domain-containing protein n=1 Tax=Paucibacter hankyongi TaxID=3133434 RepID=UPI0030B1B916
MNIKPPLFPFTSKPVSADMVAAHGPAPRAPLAQLGRVADLTGLAHTLSRELSAARRIGTRPALLLIEVAVRSPLGLRHPEDDNTAKQLQGLTERLVELLAGRLRSRVRAADVALRVGDCRLAVVLQNVERANVMAIQARLHKALSGHYELDQLSLHAVLSMGLAKCECPRISATEMTQAAEAALQLGATDARWPVQEGRRALDLHMPAPAPLGLNDFDVRGLPAS